MQTPDTLLRPSVQTSEDSISGLAQATLGGGCFWCLEPVFASLRGVKSVVPGYAGGHVSRPTYEQVCTGSTGHAEVVQVTFDPQQISYRELLEVFFAVHDPTTPNRQGADVGPQYRSIILFHTPEQERIAGELIAELNARAAERKGEGWQGNRVVTEVVPFAAFYPAEAYHQNYFQKNPYQPYCRLVIAPKLAKFRRHFAGRLA